MQATSRTGKSGFLLINFVLAALATVSAMAQQVSTPANAVAVDAVELPPFEVRTDKDEGYLAQNVASGSRLNTALLDTPAAISVFTAEFLQDIAATSISDISDYALNTMRVPGFQDGVAAGNNIVEYDTQFRIRGLPATSNTGRSVDFFKYAIEIDTFNTERVEFARGPNSILFGVGSAAGNFNVATKKADVRRPRYEVTLRGDSNDGTRAAVDIGQPLIPGKVGLRANVLKEHKNGWRPHEHKDAERLALAGRYQITSRTTFDVGLEKGHVDQANHRPWVGFDYMTDWIAKGRQLDPVRFAPFPTNASVTSIAGVRMVFDTTTGSVANWQNMTTSGPTSHFGTTAVPNSEIQLVQDFSLVPRDTVIAGPGSGSSVDYYTYSGFLRHEVTKGLFVELAFNKQDLSYLNRDMGAQNIRILFDTNAQLPDGSPNPNAGRPFVEGQQIRLHRFEDSKSYRATASYEFDLGRKFGRHQLAFLAERRDEANIRDNQAERIAGAPPTPGNPEAPTNALWRRTYVDLGGPASGIAMADFRTQPLTGTPIATTFFSNGRNAAYDYAFRFTSLMAATQSRFLDGRLAVTFGYRDDRSDSYYSEPVRGLPQQGYTLGFFEAIRNATPTELHGSTRSAGAVFHFTKRVSGFYNRSSNFALPNPQIVIFSGRPAPTARGVSEDFGLKFSFLNGRLFATATRYATASENDSDFTNAGPVNQINNIWNTLNNAGILAANGMSIDTQTVAAGGNTFDSESEGLEFELVANPVRNWRLSLNYAQNKSTKTNIGRAIVDYLESNRAFFTQGDRARLVINGTNQLAANAIDPNDALTTIAETVASADESIADVILNPAGARQTAIPRQTANLRTNYSFTEGRLNGFSAGAGIRWRGKPVIGYTSSNPATRQLIHGEETIDVDGNIGYKRKLRWSNRTIDWQLQLNVSNLFDNDDLFITAAFTDGTPRQYTLRAPREFILTSTWRF